MGRLSHLSRAIRDFQRFLFVKVPARNTPTHLQAKEECEMFLTKRGAAFDDWQVKTNSFFHESTAYYDYLATQNFLMKKMSYDFSIEDHRSKFFSLVAKAIGKCDDTARRWVVGPTLPSVQQLHIMRRSSGIKLDKATKIILSNDALSLRFSIARTLTYINAYPWETLPEKPKKDTPYAFDVWAKTKQTLDFVEYHDGPLPYCLSYNYQRVFDQVARENTKAVIDEDMIGLLKHKCEGKMVRLSDKKRRLFDEVDFHFGLMKYILSYCSAYQEIEDYAWIWNEDDPEYKEVWGYK